MSVSEFQMQVQRLHNLAKKLSDKEICDRNHIQKMIDYNSQRDIYHLAQLQQTIKRIEEKEKNVTPMLESSKREELKRIIANLDNSDMKMLINHSEKLAELTSNLKEKKKISLTKLNLPSEIREEVKADLEEISKCFAAECNRSVIILCGKVLETVLHRKYYDTTGVDILEKNPGIGLGTLIGKLKEKDVEIDPGIKQQIHLVNNVRIFSVHKKKECFEPSRAQTEAILLYTKDVIDRIF